MTARSQRVEAQSERYMELRRPLLLTLADTARTFVDMAPDGRELSDDERDQLRARLAAGAHVLREVASERELIVKVASAADERADLRPAIQILRRFQRSMVLAMSDDPERRERAGAAGDHAAVTRTVMKTLGILEAPPGR